MLHDGKMWKIENQTPLLFPNGKIEEKKKGRRENEKQLLYYLDNLKRGKKIILLF